MKFLSKKTAYIFISCGSIILSLLLCGYIPLEKIDYSLTVYAGERVYEFAYPEVDIYNGKIYLKGLDSAIQRIYSDTLLRPVDAEIFFHPNEEVKFTFKREKMGYCINAKKLKGQIIKALKNKTPTVKAEFTPLQPSITYDQLKTYTLKRGEFSTEYPYSSENRKSNIMLAANALNGIVIKNGEILSFNQTVGERTPERGYLDAVIITNGSFTEGVGGGVCQVSTTLYNAALVSLVNVVERHSHSLSVSYVEPSFDAMVSDNGSDLKLLNATGGPIFLECYADSQKITFTFYGKRRQYDVKRISQTIKTEHPGYEIIEDTSGELCGEMDEMILAQPKMSVVSVGSVEYYLSGKLVKNMSLSKDFYGGIKGKIAKKPPKTNINDEKESAA